MYRFILSFSFLLPLIGSPQAVAQTKPIVPDKGKVYKVPYRLTETLHMVVRVKLNGKGPFNLIVDTGAPMVVITTKVADQAEAVTEDSGWSLIKTFEMEGGAKLENVQVLAEDIFQLKGMNGMGLAGRTLHGVIGYTVLSQYEMKFDLQKRFMQWTRLDSKIPRLIPLRKDKDGKPVTGSPELNAMAGFMQTMGGAFTGNKVPPIQRGSLGIAIEPVKDGEGVRVSKIYSGTPAAGSALKVGDIIRKLGRKRTKSVNRLLQAAAKIGVDQTVTILADRDGDEIEVEIKAGKGL